MRISELAQRTGTTPRLLRYYEEQGLLTPQRAANGYRDYDDRLVGRVEQIRGLLGAGMSTRLIKLILPCLNDGGYHIEEIAPQTRALLEDERAKMDDRIACLMKNRDAIDEYLHVVTCTEEAVVDGVGVSTP